jgi:Carboxypeptidase regulatory-like domain
MFLAALVMGLAASAFGQTGNAQLGGTVQDPSKALVPGVTITATNIETNVTVTQITNETGAYSFPVLQPGSYRVSADLPGFKKQVFNDVRLPYAGQIRIDFTLQLGEQAQTVEVSVASDSVLRDSSASVGDVLTQERITSLPLVGNNVLDLLNTLPGLNINPAGEIFNTVNGLGINTINATRDGLSINDVRIAAQDSSYVDNGNQYAGYKLMSPTTLLPDLVGEIRMILSPADAELGRGNAQVQILTRSGTNRYTGSATWNVRNTALDSNTWTNNHTIVNGKATPLDWQNNHQYTIAYGGPIKIPGLYDGTNKTFFYALWEQNIHNSRDTTNINVLTDTARMGIYRYFTGYAPTGFNPGNAILSQTFPLTVTNATWVAVDVNGNPVPPPFNPDGTAYTGRLMCFSVFGNQRLDANGNMVPFTDADCAGGTRALPPAGSTAWDAFRPVFDTSGFQLKMLSLAPRANYFGSGDGLNVAQYRYLRGRGGSNSTRAVVGADLFANSKQFNLKLDHNFTANHRVAVSYTVQRDNSADNVAQYPTDESVNGAVIRRPYVLTANVTSTLGSRMINEARFGVNHNYNYDVPAWFHPDDAVREKAEQYLLRGATSTLNPDYQYLTVVNNGCCGVTPNILNSNGVMATTGTNILQFNNLWNYADTLSWSSGRHSFKVGGEWRLPRTTGNGGIGNIYPTISLGTLTGGPASPFAGTTFPTELPGLINGAATGATNPRTTATNLLMWMSGSVASATQQYWITSSQNIQSGLWSDVSTAGGQQRLRKQVSNEGAVFFKDDYKVTRRLTLNLGVRWEYTGPSYIDGGFTSAVLDQGYGAFGPTRVAQSTLDAFKQDPFSLFLKPGNLYLTGYGTNAGNPLSCQTGVQQNSLLPVSTCDPSALSAIQFVGPGSPNPGTNAMPVNYYDIGPAVGFSYSLPWFGDGKTTIRGGYQQTFGAGSVNRGALFGGTEASLANAPGVVTTGTVSATDPSIANILATRALTLSDVATIVPTRPQIPRPGGAVPIYGPGVAAVVFDPNIYTPYTQNVNFSVTRQVQKNVTLDLRYVGTFARKQSGGLNLNTPNVYHNPELFQALTDARAGTCTPGAYPTYTTQGINPCDVNNDPVLLDQLLAGLNLNPNISGTGTAGAFGQVGSVNSAGIFQSGAQHLRRSGAFTPALTTIQTALANGDFNNVAGALLTLAPNGTQGLPIDPQTGTQITGVRNRALRNGCDRMANGFSIVQQTTAGGAQVANSGTAIPLRCFPEDFLITNPQFSSITYNTNLGHSNYHSFQASVTLRPVHGVSTQATWVWSKSMALPTSGYYDPAQRNLNFGAQNIAQHTLRMNGTVELPIGPGKLLLGNSSGWVARVLERWQTSFIANMSSGSPATLTPGQNHFYSASGFNRWPGWVMPHGSVDWNVVNQTTGAITGSYYGNPSPFLGVRDPQCLNPSIVTPGDKMGTSLAGTNTCLMTSLAKRNPDGTQGEYLLTYPMPGQVGDSGNGTIKLFGQWSLDMNASKTFRITESKSLAVRIDATDILNHPVPNRPDVSALNLGAINGKGNQTRQLQGQLRLSF